MGVGRAPVIIMHRLSSSFRAALSGPCSARRVLTLRGVLLTLLARDSGDLASVGVRASLAGDIGEAGVLPEMLVRLPPEMSTCSNTRATACGHKRGEAFGPLSNYYTNS
jgi:hypothetical protein